VEEGAEGTKFGYILRGFPFNTQQALLLDRYLNGVNLAIHLTTPADPADYSASIKPLLNYYNERVTPLARRAPSSNSHTPLRTTWLSWKRPSRKLGSTSSAPRDLCPIITILHRGRRGNRRN
jgi:adenylate kinase family enzyme